MAAKLTIKEAIAQGYTHYGYAGRDYQSLSRIEDLTDRDLKELEEKVVLAEKETMHHSVSAEDIREFATESYYGNDEFSIDDTNDMEHMMKDPKHNQMFEDFATKLNEIYKEKVFYRITDIELVVEENI